MGSEDDMRLYSMEDVQKHGRFENQLEASKSYWIVIHDKVYDVTKWLDDHPGGEDVLMENSGTDASEPWEDIGHSSEAREKMKQYQIGELRPEDRKNRVDKGPTNWKPNESLSTNSEDTSNFNWMVIFVILVGVEYLFSQIFSLKSF